MKWYCILMFLFIVSCAKDLTDNDIIQCNEGEYKISDQYTQVAKAKGGEASHILLEKEKRICNEYIVLDEVIEPNTSMIHMRSCDTDKFYELKNKATTDGMLTIACKRP